MTATLSRPAPAPALDPAQLVEFTRFIADEVRRGQHLFGFGTADRWHQRIYRDQRVDVWLISWLPEQGTELHDHGGSAGAFTVLAGELTEAVLEPVGPTTDALRRRRHAAGDSIGFDGRHVHDVRNAGTGPALSVHAYSTPLTRMNFYDLNGGILTRIASVATDNPETTLR